MSPNDLLYKKGTIQKKVANTNTGLDWPSLTFEAALQGDDFQTLTIMTLISHYEMLCQEMAIFNIASLNPNDKDWDKKIDQYAKKLMNSGSITVREQVTVDDNYHAVVIIDEPSIIDGTITRALQMLEQSNVPGATNFSEPKTFTYKEFLERKEKGHAKKLQNNKTNNCTN